MHMLFKAFNVVIYLKKEHLASGKARKFISSCGKTPNNSLSSHLWLSFPGVFLHIWFVVCFYSFSHSALLIILTA